MKITLINTFYNFESTGKLMHNFRNYLEENGIETMVLFGHGEENPRKRIFRLSSDLEGKLHNGLGRLTGLNGCFSPLATAKAFRLIDEFQPDIVYLGNLHGHYINIYRLYEFLRSKEISIVQIMWDEYSMTGACAFSYECENYRSLCHDCTHKKDYPISWLFDTSRLLQNKKKHAYANQKITFVGVPYTADKARQSSLLSNYPVQSLDEAVDQKTLFYPRDPSELKQELGISPDKKVILNVCPYPSIRKGGAYYLELARSCLENPDLVFVHVGFKADPSICPSNFIPIGYVRDQNLLAQYYSMADLFLCTSQAETQPNTCIEALSCGTPILGFDISGIPSCAPPPYGHYVPFKDIASLKEEVIKTPRKTRTFSEEIRHYAESRFSSDDYNRRLLEIGEQLIKTASPKASCQSGTESE